MESGCLMNTEFQFGKIRKFRRWMVMVAQQVQPEPPEDMDWIHSPLSGVGGHCRERQ